MTPPGQAASRAGANADPGYSVVGPEHGLPIVFVHGIRMNRGMWEPQMTALQDEFRAVAMDLPGHGVCRGSAFSLELCCEHLARAIREAAGGRALLVGLSMGGYVSMAFGARYPEMLHGLVLSGASAQPTGPWVWAYRAGGVAAGVLPEGLLSAANAAWLRLQFGPIAEPTICRGFGFRCVADAVGEIAGRDFVTLLAGFQGPVLLLNGARDVLFGRDLRRFAEATSACEVEILAGAGHLSSLQRPEAFSAAVRRFARRLRDG
jgi:pimeloyl-ACP methyl ester carboxylesterase